MGKISEELGEWIRGGHPGAIATTNADGTPVIMRLWVSLAVESGSALDIYVVASDAAQTLKNLATGSPAAVTLVETTTYRSIQFVGLCAPSPNAPDRKTQDLGLHKMSQNFAAVGLKEDDGARMLAHYYDGQSMIVLRLHVNRIYDQSPKPGAGAEL